MQCCVAIHRHARLYSCRSRLDKERPSERTAPETKTRSGLARSGRQTPLGYRSRNMYMVIISPLELRRRSQGAFRSIGFFYDRLHRIRVSLRAFPPLLTLSDCPSSPLIDIMRMRYPGPRSALAESATAFSAAAVFPASPLASAWLVAVVDASSFFSPPSRAGGGLCGQGPAPPAA